MMGVKGNCTKLQRFNGTTWDTISKRVSITGPGLTRETVEEDLVIDCDLTGGNPTKKKSPGTKEIGDISVEIIWNPTTPTGTNQVETATGAGTVTTAGNAVVTITSDKLDTGSQTFSIPVSLGTPTVWMAEVRNYLLTHASATALRSHFDIGGSGATLVLTASLPEGNDSTLNVLIGTGTATGITNAATSANTTPGIAGFENDENHHLFEDDFFNETASLWRIVHPNDAGSGVLVHATVKEVGEPSYEVNANVKRTVMLEPTGQYYFAGNGIESATLPPNLATPEDHYGHH